MSGLDGLQLLRRVVQSLPLGDQLDYVLRELAAATNCSVLLYDSGGELLGATGEAPIAMIWEVALESEGDANARIGRWEIRVRRATSGTGPFTLVFARKSDAPLRLDGDVVDAAEIAVAALLGMARGADIRRIRENAELLETLELGVSAAREHRFWPRLVEFGFVAHAPFVVVVWEHPDEALRGAEFIGDLMDAAPVDMPLLVATRLIRAASDEIVHAIVPDSPTAFAWLDSLAAQGLFLGASRPVSRLDGVPNALREAELAQRVAAERQEAYQLRFGDEHSSGELVDFGAMSIIDWVTCQAAPGELRTRRRGVLEPLQGNAELCETLVTYFASGGSVQRTAELLYLHANTIRYRLARCGELLGGEVDDPMIVSELVLVLRAEILATRARLEAATARPAVTPG